MGSWLFVNPELFAELSKAGHIGRVHRIIAVAIVQLASFLQSCLKLGYSEACAIHLGIICWFLACDGASSWAKLCT